MVILERLALVRACRSKFGARNKRSVPMEGRLHVIGGLPLRGGNSWRELDSDDYGADGMLKMLLLMTLPSTRVLMAGVELLSRS